MIDGLYAAASGMYAQQGRMDAISVDLANLNTVGYKSQHYGFWDLLYQAQGNNRAMDGGNTGSGVRGAVIDRAMTQGAISATTSPTDLAIQGPGFFAVRLEDGRTGLTRAGNFTLDAQGRLATADGELLIPQVTVPANVSVENVAVDPDGRVHAGAQQLGFIRLVNVVAPERLSSLGGNLYAPNADSGQPFVIQTTGIEQRALEGSNTDVSQSLTDMIQAQRSYELCSRALRTWDDMLQTANSIRR